MSAHELAGDEIVDAEYARTFSAARGLTRHRWGRSEDRLVPVWVDVLCRALRHAVGRSVLPEPLQVALDGDFLLTRGGLNDREVITLARIAIRCCLVLEDEHARLERAAVFLAVRNATPALADSDARTAAVIALASAFEAEVPGLPIARRRGAP